MNCTQSFATNLNIVLRCVHCNKKMRYLLSSLKQCGFQFGRNVEYNSVRKSSSFSGSFKYLNNVKTSYVKTQLSLPQLNFKRECHLTDTKELLENARKDSISSNTTEDSGFNSITNGDPMLEKKLKMLFLEAEVIRQSGGRVPDNIKLEQWKELLQMDTRNRRRKYLAYLFGVEKKKESKTLKKEARREERERYFQESKEVAVSSAENDGHVEYRLGRNSIFLRIYDGTITQFQNYRLIQAMQFGQKLVIDCGYDSHMTKQEALNCGKQLMLLFSDNRAHNNPFDLYMCNANSESISMQQLEKYIPTLHEPYFPLNITPRSYLDIFPKEKIVYLTPHCREELADFDHDAVYIVGAMVDKANNEPLSLAKAKREGLKMAKLPIDKYLLWGTGGSKSLTMNQMIRILLDIRTSGDWNKALEHVPRRKIVSSQNKGFEKSSLLKSKRRLPVSLSFKN